MSNASRARLRALRLGTVPASSPALAAAVSIPIAAPPASLSVAIVAPRRSARVPAWLTAEFPNTTILGLAIAAMALAVFFWTLALPDVLATTVDEHIVWGGLDHFESLRSPRRPLVMEDGSRALAGFGVPV